MPKNKALFLDRDGVINVEKNYVYKVEDFEFTDGILNVMRYFQGRGYLLIVITNQAGIGRGYYTEEDFNRLNEWMLNRLAEEGIHVTKVYYCPYHPEFGLGQYKKDSFDRKPNPGMILRAAADYDIDLKPSILIGDKESDISAGQRSGIEKTILLSKVVCAATTAKYVVNDLNSILDILT